MKFLHCFVALVFGACAIGTHAQSSEGGSPYAKKSYNELRIGYTISMLRGDASNMLSAENGKDPDAGLNLNGASLAYVHGFALSKRWFLEAGVAGYYNNTSYNTRDYNYKQGKDIKINYPVTLIDAEIPVNVVFDIHVCKGIMISPYLGGHFKYNIVAQKKQILNAKYNFSGEQTHVVDKDHWVKKFDYFDKDLMGDHTWKRMQYGPQAGIKIRYSKYMLAAQYEMDFPNPVEDCATSRISVSLGYRF